MGPNFRLYVLVLSFLATAASLGCGGADSTELPMPATAQPVSLTVEPGAIAPEFVPGGGCPAHQPFDLRFAVRLGGRSDVAFHRLRFRYEDRFGHVVTPRVILAYGEPPPPSSLPNSGPVPMPSSSPIPMPSATTLPGSMTAFGNARHFPLWLKFDCGIGASGILFVIADGDDRGHGFSSEVRVPVQ